MLSNQNDNNSINREYPILNRFQIKTQQTTTKKIIINNNKNKGDKLFIFSHVKLSDISLDTTVVVVVVFFFFKIKEKNKKQNHTTL